MGPAELVHFCELLGISVCSALYRNLLLWVCDSLGRPSVTAKAQVKNKKCILAGMPTQDLQASQAVQNMSCARPKISEIMCIKHYVIIYS